MKKLLIFTTVMVLTVFAGVCLAVDQKNTGCGLGSMAWSGQNGLFSQTCAATTNGTFGNQTFGITTGTSNCEQYKTVTFNEKLNVFVADNMGSLAKDMAKGSGEYLNTLAVLMSVPETERTGFYSTLQSNFPSIYTSETVTPADILKNIERVTSSI
jgi:hypothetical protein